MSFFEPPPPDEPDEEKLPPVWAGPGDNELGEEIVIEQTLGESPSALVSLRSVTAYRNGLTLHLAARKKRPPEPPSLDPDADEFFPSFDHLDVHSDAFLRLGVQFADGGKATNLERRHSWWDDSEPPPAPYLDADTDTSGNSVDAWLWPLPPPETLVVVCEWIAEGIPESRHSLDVAPLIQASRRAPQIW